MWALRAYLCVGTRCTPAPSEAWLYSLLLFRALHLLLTIVAWQHFFQNKYYVQLANVPEGAPNYWLKRLMPPFEFGLVSCNFSWRDVYVYRQAKQLTLTLYIMNPRFRCMPSSSSWHSSR